MVPETLLAALLTAIEWTIHIAPHGADRTTTYTRLIGRTCVTRAAEVFRSFLLLRPPDLLGHWSVGDPTKAQCTLIWGVGDLTNPGCNRLS